VLLVICACLKKRKLENTKTDDKERPMAEEKKRE